MLFNTYEFILLFLPLCAIAYFTCVRFFSFSAALGLLVFASLLFYASWNPVCVVLLLVSIGFNYLLGLSLSRADNNGKKLLLGVGVLANLGLLVFFKTANLYAEISDAPWEAGDILLPLAISFFTFQQISYLIDVYRGDTREHNLMRYSLFVCFFPQLIAGPIVRHGELMPQFKESPPVSLVWINIAVGVSIFALGLFKKTVIADGLGEFVTPIFDTRRPPVVDFFRAWGSSLAYTFQLYFDFSGYVDMAIGAARIFGVRLPLNFYSPYRASNILEFWQRWHITFTRFLRDYVYLPLGENGKGRGGFIALILVLPLVGLWHGASWPFLIWGALHGCYLVIHRAWFLGLGRMGLKPSRYAIYRVACWVLTLITLVFSWVYFRAPTLEHGNAIALAMLGQTGFEIPDGILVRLGAMGEQLSALGFVPAMGGGALLMTNFFWIAISLFIVLVLPNTAQLFRQYEPVIYESTEPFEIRSATVNFRWTMSRRWALAVVIMGVAGLLTLQHVSEFIYFRF